MREQWMSASLACQVKGEVTRGERVLFETDAAMPWGRLLLGERSSLLKAETIVDATNTDAPSSTKSATRDTQMKQTKKGAHWYFGMRIHVCTDTQGLVHNVIATDSALADNIELPALVHGCERTRYGDQPYWTEDRRFHWQALGDRHRVNRGTTIRSQSEHRRALNGERSRYRARGEHAFLVIKGLWAFVTVCYRGVAKNAARAFTLLAPATVYRMRRRPLPRDVVAELP